MTEYGVFEDGACIEAGFHGETGKADAEAHMADLIAADPDMASAYEVAEICPDHEEQPKNGCEECAEEEDADDSAPECPYCGAPADASGCRIPQHDPHCPTRDPHF